MSKLKRAVQHLGRAAMALAGAARLDDPWRAGARRSRPTTPASALRTPHAGRLQHLFVLVDPGALLPNGRSVPALSHQEESYHLLNHQAGSCVCSAARSVVYTGQQSSTRASPTIETISERDLRPASNVGQRLANSDTMRLPGQVAPVATLDLTDKRLMRGYAIRRHMASYGSRISSRGLIDDDAAIATTTRRLPRQSPGAGPRRRRSGPRVSPGIWRELVNPHD